MALPVQDISPQDIGSFKPLAYGGQSSAFAKGWGGEPSAQNDLGKPTRSAAKTANDPIKHLKDRADELGDSATGGLGGLAGTVIDNTGKYAQVAAAVGLGQLGFGRGGDLNASDNIWQTGQDASITSPAAPPAFVSQAAEIFRNMASMSLNQVEQAAGDPTIWQALGFENISNATSGQLGRWDVAQDQSSQSIGRA